MIHHHSRRVVRMEISQYNHRQSLMDDIEQFNDKKESGRLTFLRNNLAGDNL